MKSPVIYDEQNNNFKLVSTLSMPLSVGNSALDQTFDIHDDSKVDPNRRSNNLLRFGQFEFIPSDLDIFVSVGRP